MEMKPMTVSQLNNYINKILKFDKVLSNLTISGEITGFKRHTSGHYYFSIKDSLSKVNCFLSKNLASMLIHEFQEGMEVVIEGFLSVYEPNGTYSIFVKKMEPIGEGSLSIAFELMKEKLAKEGLFDKTHKKALPKFPQKIGIVTSDTGAALKDILKIIQSKNNIVSILIFPCLVQGAKAAEDISKNIEMANKKFPTLDLLIVGRGGGSTEDLWCFNEEVVARAIYNSNIPIISAVGHEIDFTIGDMVADVRAETPTAAAEMAVYNSYELENFIEDLKKGLLENLSYKENFCSSKLDLFRKFLDREYVNKLEGLSYIIEKNKIILEENNPKKIMSLGYSMVKDLKHNILTSVKEIKVEDLISIQMEDGKATCRVLEIQED